jgi:hypothetical protein
MTARHTPAPSEFAVGSPSDRPSWMKLLPILATALVTVVGIPVLEINDSHLFNPDWPPHARLHEAWQLGTNAGLALTAVWLAFKGLPRLASGLALLIVAPLLIAYALRSGFGGSMSRDGLNDTIAGASGIPVIIMLLLAASLLPGLTLEKAGSR